MANVDMSAFLPIMLPHAPGIPTVTAEFQLRLAVIEFCERTRCWRHMIDVEFTNDNHQAVVAPDYATIHDFEFAVFSSEGVERRPLVPTLYSEIGPDGLDLYAGSPPDHISQVTPNTVTIFPFKAGTVSLSVFLKPRHGQDFTNAANTTPMQDHLNQVPEFLHTQWGEAISAGALARCLSMPAKEWTNPQLAGYHAARFERYCDALFSTNIVGQQRAPRRIKPNYF